jgi:hypothetical protein
MLFYESKFCDCCKRKLTLPYYYEREDGCYAFRVDTTEGVKWICSTCLYAYNILDRLPNEKERLMDRKSLMKRREQEKKFN